MQKGSGHPTSMLEQLDGQRKLASSRGSVLGVVDPTIWLLEELGWGCGDTGDPGMSEARGDETIRTQAETRG